MMRIMISYPSALIFDIFSASSSSATRAFTGLQLVDLLELLVELLLVHGAKDINFPGLVVLGHSLDACAAVTESAADLLQRIPAEVGFQGSTLALANQLVYVHFVYFFGKLFSGRYSLYGGP